VCLVAQYNVTHPVWTNFCGILPASSRSAGHFRSPTPWVVYPPPSAGTPQALWDPHVPPNPCRTLICTRAGELRPHGLVSFLILCFAKASVPVPSMPSITIGMERQVLLITTLDSQNLRNLFPWDREKKIESRVSRLINIPICMSVCLSVWPLTCLANHVPKLHEIFSMC